jgi:hypothetical protein
MKRYITRTTKHESLDDKDEHGFADHIQNAGELAYQKRSRRCLFHAQSSRH